MDADSPIFKFQLDGFNFTFKTKPELVGNHKLYIEYDIEVNGVYSATTCAKECLSYEQEDNFRLKAATQLLKIINNQTFAKSVKKEKKVFFNNVKVIYEYNYDKSSYNNYYQIY